MRSPFITRWVLSINGEYYVSNSKDCPPYDHNSKKWIEREGTKIKTLDMNDDRLWVVSPGVGPAAFPYLDEEESKKLLVGSVIGIVLANTDYHSEADLMDDGYFALRKYIRSPSRCKWVKTDENSYQAQCRGVFHNINKNAYAYCPSCGDEIKYE